MAILAGATLAGAIGGPRDALLRLVAPLPGAGGFVTLACLCGGVLVLAVTLAAPVLLPPLLALLLLGAIIQSRRFLAAVKRRLLDEGRPWLEELAGFSHSRPPAAASGAGEQHEDWLLD